MPHISIRMSASSSTTRMSCAMNGCLFCSADAFLVRRHDQMRLDAKEYQGDPRAALFPILEDQLSSMVFHDLLDDGKAEAGAFGTRRDIGLDQPLAALFGQAAAIVLDHERRLARRFAYAHGDLARRCAI